MYEERQIKAEEREEKRFAKRQAAAAARDRKKAEEDANELASALSVFYSPDRVTQIMSKGKTAANFFLETGTTALSKGVDPNTLVRFATNEKGDVDESVVTETLDVEMATPAPAPDDLVETTTASSLSLDTSAYSELFVKPDKEVPDNV